MTRRLVFGGDIQLYTGRIPTFSVLTVFLWAQWFRLEHWVFCAAVSFGYLSAEISQIRERLVAAGVALDFGGSKLLPLQPIWRP